MTQSRFLIAVALASLGALFVNIETSFAQDNGDGTVTLEASPDTSLTPAGEIAPEKRQFPLRYYDRPLNLYKGLLRADLTFGVSHIIGQTGTGLPVVGSAYGITDNIEVGLNVLPLTFSPNFKYGYVPALINPSAYFQYLIHNKDGNQLGARVGLAVPAIANSGTTVQIALPALLRRNNFWGIDSGLYSDITFDRLGETYAEFSLPVRIWLQPDPHIHFGTEDSFRFSTRKIYALGADQFAIPLGLFADYTIGNGQGGPLADIGAVFRSDDILQGFDAWTLLATARVFLPIL